MKQRNYYLVSEKIEFAKEAFECSKNKTYTYDEYSDINHLSRSTLKAWVHKYCISSPSSNDGEQFVCISNDKKERDSKIEIKTEYCSINLDTSLDVKSIADVLNAIKRASL